MIQISNLYNKKTTIVIALLALLTLCYVFFSSSKEINFNTEVKPLLNKKCISCHGGVKKEAGFSLLFEQDAFAKNESGKPAIIPGDPDNSELIKRLVTADLQERMPYKHPPLSKEEITLLKTWIKQGAKWGNHWAYIPVEQVDVPNSHSFFIANKWVKNDIDHFIYKSAKDHGLTPVEEASKEVLLRRVSLDLIGMPAPRSLANQFLNNNQANAYELLVDALLASPHFGERWAAVWMDLARYADTKGYERDGDRSIWRYRDWLIKAFNQNKPYNDFLIEQLAGDLLTNPSDDQFIATAFHRNTVTNDEGGTDNEEFRTAAVIDRVNTTWETLMSTTFACVQCHSHPYDPFTQEEYYKFLAFFNNSRDEDTYDDYPLLREFHQNDSIKFQFLKKWLQKNAPDKAAPILTFVKTGEPAIHSIVADSLINSALADTKWLVLRNNAVARIKNVILQNQTQLMVRLASWKTGGKWNIHVNSPNGPIISTYNVENTNGQWKVLTIPINPLNAKQNLYFTYTNKNLSNAQETGLKFDWFHFTQPFPAKAAPQFDTAYTYFVELIQPKQATYTPVMYENPDALFRSTAVFIRGNRLTLGKEVKPGVPASLNPFADQFPKNRLGMALWMTDKKNPLTSRTIVNRIWEQFFGQGIVETLEDIGTQGIPPTHQSLLDYLSFKLMHEFKWDLKKLMKEIALSATYRQDSKINQEGADKDPYNKFYARGARVRLSAEQIRDQALAVSGVLNANLYGASVFPYQPPNIWMSPYNGSSWVMNTDGNQYRRALYTFWKRSAPYPSMIMFDETSKEVCVARRIKTNTPLQALTVLNDAAYMEMAQHFATAMFQSKQPSIADKINHGYTTIFYSAMAKEKLVALNTLYKKAFQHYKSEPGEIEKIAGTKSALKTPELAALVVVANAMLNLDECITKN
jgi:hypothetical protein